MLHNITIKTSPFIVWMSIQRAEQFLSKLERYYKMKKSTANEQLLASMLRQNQDPGRIQK